MVTRAQPTILIGTSTQAGAFTETIVKQMASWTHRDAAGYGGAVSRGLVDEVDATIGLDQVGPFLANGQAPGTGSGPKLHVDPRQTT